MVTATTEHCPDGGTKVESKVDGDLNEIVLTEGTIFCVKGSTDATGQLIADGETNLVDYLDNGHDVSYYVTYGVQPSATPSGTSRPTFTPNPTTSPTPTTTPVPTPTEPVPTQSPSPSPSVEQPPRATSTPDTTPGIDKVGLPDTSMLGN